MILADTNVWADHFRGAVDGLAPMLAKGRVLQHPFVTGELAMGNPDDRRGMVARLDALPQAEVTGWSDLLEFVERHHLGGTGIGYVDAHLLAAAHAQAARLWTGDKRLAREAERLGLNHSPG